MRATERIEFNFNNCQYRADLINTQKGEKVLGDLYVKSLDLWYYVETYTNHFDLVEKYIKSNLIIPKTKNPLDLENNRYGLFINEKSF